MCELRGCDPNDDAGLLATYLIGNRHSLWINASIVSLRSWKMTNRETRQFLSTVHVVNHDKFQLKQTM